MGLPDEDASELDRLPAGAGQQASTLVDEGFKSRLLRALPGCGLLALGLFLYRDLLGWLWWNVSTGRVESHCAAVPLLAVGLYWMRREELEAIPVSSGDRSNGVGLVLAMWACVLELLATAADSLLASGISLILLVHGVALALAGARRVRVLLAPIYFLVFMLPLRYPVEVLLGFPLRLLSTRLSEVWLHLAGAEVMRFVASVYEWPEE